jgi:UDP-N-acetylglucosamine acyltransferase
MSTASQPKQEGSKETLRHPLAYIHPDAKIADNVVVDPFASIHADVEIGSGCWIGSNAVIHNGARIGKNTRIFPGAVISTIPQDLKFGGEYSTVQIGDNCTIREYATVNRGTNYSGTTKVGNHVLIMAYAHVAHDCVIGDHVILANAVNLAGHVVIDDHAIVGGMSAIHQFVRLGRHSILQGGSLVGKDVPPFTKGARYPLSYVGVNTVGLKRRGYDAKQIHEIHEIYRLLFAAGKNTSQALESIEAEIPDSEVRAEIIEFVRSSPRGIMKGLNKAGRGDD